MLIVLFWLYTLNWYIFNIYIYSTYYFTQSSEEIIVFHDFNEQKNNTSPDTNVEIDLTFKWPFEGSVYRLRPSLISFITYNT